MQTRVRAGDSHGYQHLLELHKLWTYKRTMVCFRPRVAAKSHASTTAVASSNFRLSVSRVTGGMPLPLMRLGSFEDTRVHMDTGKAARSRG
jgi:hypothetical protein